MRWASVEGGSVVVGFWRLRWVVVMMSDTFFFSFLFFFSPPFLFLTHFLSLRFPLSSSLACFLSLLFHSPSIHTSIHSLIFNTFSLWQLLVQERG